MKELIKPKKKKEVFEKMDIKAFHEQNGQYSEGGEYEKSYGSWPYDRDTYTKDNKVLGDDILF